MNPRHLPHDWYPGPLPPNVEIGPESWLYSAYAFLHYRSLRPLGLRVGHDSGIYDGTMFELGPYGEVRIGNFATVVGAIFAVNGRVEIGDYAFLAHQVVVADHFAAGPWGGGAPQPSGPTPPTIIGANAWVGARATIQAGVRVGEGAVVGAAAVVTDDVPAFMIAVGNPARVVAAVPRRSSDALR